MTKSAGTIAGLVIAGLFMASCVASDTPIVANAKPLLGQQFHMVMYRDFQADKGFDAQQVTYRWEEGNYVRASATTASVVRFVAEPLETCRSQQNLRRRRA